MSPYTFGGLLIGFVAWSGFMYYEGNSKEAVVCKANDALSTVAGYQKKDEVNTKQTAITQSEVSTYEKTNSDIGALYPDSVPGISMPQPVPGVSTSAVGVKPASCARNSKEYHLTFKQCDEVKNGFDTLYDRDVKLSNVK